MSIDTFFPILDEHTYTAAEHVVSLVDDPDADAEISADVRARLLESAQSALSTRADQATRQGLWRFAQTTLVEKNEEADDAVTELNLALRLKGEHVYATHRQLWGGETAGELVKRPYPSQIQTVRGYLARVDADPAAANGPAERIERVRETNDALEGAWKGEREAKRAWTVASEAAEDARDAFLTDYRATVRFVIAVYGEDRARLALPRFPRVGKKKG